MLSYWREFRYYKITFNPQLPQTSCLAIVCRGVKNQSPVHKLLWSSSALNAGQLWQCFILGWELILGCAHHKAPVFPGLTLPLLAGRELSIFVHCFIGGSDPWGILCLFGSSWVKHSRKVLFKKFLKSSKLSLFRIQHSLWWFQPKIYGSKFSSTDIRKRHFGVMWHRIIVGFFNWSQTFWSQKSRLIPCSVHFPLHWPWQLLLNSLQQFLLPFISCCFPREFWF